MAAAARWLRIEFRLAPNERKLSKDLILKSLSKFRNNLVNQFQFVLDTSDYNIELGCFVIKGRTTTEQFAILKLKVENRDLLYLAKERYFNFDGMPSETDSFKSIELAFTSLPNNFPSLEAEFSQRLAEKDIEIKQIKAEKDAEIAALKKEFSQRLAEKDAEIKELRRENMELKRTVADQQRTIADLKHQVVDLQRTVADLQRTVAELMKLVPCK